MEIRPDRRVSFDHKWFTADGMSLKLLRQGLPLHLEHQGQGLTKIGLTFFERGPWLMAPGTSSTKPTHQFSSWVYTAVNVRSAINSASSASG